MGQRAIIFSFIEGFTYNLTFDRKYNSDKSLKVSSFEYLTLPYRMIVTGTNNTRAVYLQDAAEYAEINDIGLEIMDKLLTSDMPKYTTITRAEWEQALKGNSILMDYGTTMSMKLMLQLRSRLDSVLASLIGGFSEITIAPSESETNTAYIYIHDNQNGSYYRFTASCDKQKLKSMIDSLSGYQKQKYAFAFEMNLHKKDTNIVTPVDRMYLEPLVCCRLISLKNSPCFKLQIRLLIM